MEAAVGHLAKVGRHWTPQKSTATSIFFVVVVVVIVRGLVVVVGGDLKVKHSSNNFNYYFSVQTA